MEKQNKKILEAIEVYRKRVLIKVKQRRESLKDIQSLAIEEGNKLLENLSVECFITFESTDQWMSDYGSRESSHYFEKLGLGVYRSFGQHSTRQPILWTEPSIVQNVGQGDEKVLRKGKYFPGRVPG